MLNDQDVSIEEIKILKEQANRLRKKVLEMAVNAGAGHVAPSFSCMEILVSLYYGGILRVDGKDHNWPDRDRFILSKGHAAPALYAILADLGFFPKSDLDSFAKNGSHLGCHPENSTPGIEAFTGSLGHGLSIGAGLALGAKLDKKDHSTVVLMGDGECHEGSVWEAAMFAAQYKLNNLIAIVDHNGLSATGILDQYLSVSPLQKKWEAFGWDSISVQGHSFNELLHVLRENSSRERSRPLAIIALTTKGKGVSFMENSPIWHYRVPLGEQLDIARRELNLESEEL
ncbi:MAG: transketolase [Candidatus Omnitrophica bacterium]|nr:transketolase [Candidatus Omnitrophota bacterium]